MIHLFSSHICQQAKDAVAETLDSGWIGLGPRTEEFELAFAEYCKAKYAVAVSSATAALDLAVKSLGLGPGDEVITTSMTFVSTNHVILYSGATPVFVDIDPATLNLDLNLIEVAITEKTKAIMVVHYAGNPVDLHQLYTLAKKHGLPVIEDAAHACGAFYKTGPVGSFGLTCFSFHAVKNLPTGDGGMVTTNDRGVYDRLRRLRWLGIDKSTFDRRTSDGYKWEYDVSELGTKSHMNDITAAMGIEQLKGLDCWNALRADIVWRYVYGLSSCAEILDETEGAISANHLMVIKVDNRDRVVSRLREKGVETGVHYKPNHLYDMYQQYVRHPLVETEEAYRHIISLPLHLGLSDEDVNFVIESVKESL